MKKSINTENRIKQTAYPILTFVILIISWEIIVKAKDIKEYILPSPTSIAYEFKNSFDILLIHTLVTLKEAILGFIFGIIISIILGFLMSSIKVLKKIFYPLLVLSQTIPIVALAPLITIWFGIGIFPKVIVCVLVVFFPVTLSLTEGLYSYDTELLELLKSMNASKLQIFTKVKLPSALPYFFSGLKIAAAYSVMGAVLSEWTGAKNGLGIYLTRMMKSFRTAAFFADIVIISTFSILLFLAISFIEKKLIKGR